MVVNCWERISGRCNSKIKEELDKVSLIGERNEGGKGETGVGGEKGKLKEHSFSQMIIFTWLKKLDICIKNNS